MNSPWYPYIVPKDNPRYYSATKFKYDPIAGKDNDWEIMYFIDKGTHEQEYKEVHKIVLNGFGNNRAQTIKVGSVGAINFISSPCILQENKTIDGKVMKSG